MLCGASCVKKTVYAIGSQLFIDIIFNITVAIYLSVNSYYVS